MQINVIIHVYDYNLFILKIWEIFPNFLKNLIEFTLEKNINFFFGRKKKKNPKK